MQFSPVHDEMDLRTRSRDELVRLVLDLSVSRVQLEQKVHSLSNDNQVLSLRVEELESELTAPEQKQGGDGSSEPKHKNRGK